MYERDSDPRKTVSFGGALPTNPNQKSRPPSHKRTKKKTRPTLPRSKPRPLPLSRARFFSFVEAHGALVRARGVDFQLEVEVGGGCREAVVPALGEVGVGGVWAVWGGEGGVSGRLGGVGGGLGGAHAWGLGHGKGGTSRRRYFPKETAPPERRMVLSITFRVKMVSFAWVLQGKRHAGGLLLFSELEPEQVDARKASDDISCV